MLSEQSKVDKKRGQGEESVREMLKASIRMWAVTLLFIQLIAVYPHV